MRVYSEWLEWGKLRESLAKPIINKKYQSTAGHRPGYGDPTASVQTLQPLLDVELIQGPNERRPGSPLSPGTQLLLGLDRAFDGISREESEVIQNSRARS